MPLRAILTSLVALAVTVLAGCGDGKPPPPLDRELIARSKLPPAVPKLKRSVGDAGLGRYLEVVAPDDPKGRNFARNALHENGFTRGSARDYSSRGRGGKDALIYTLLQSVAELESPNSAKEVVDLAAKRLLKRKRARELGTKLGEYSRSVELIIGARDAPLYVYVFQWQRQRLAFFLSVVPNPNGAYSARDGVTSKRMLQLAHRAADYMPPERSKQ